MLPWSRDSGVNSVERIVGTWERSAGFRCISGYFRDISRIFWDISGCFRIFRDIDGRMGSKREPSSAWTGDSMFACSLLPAYYKLRSVACEVVLTPRLAHGHRFLGGRGLFEVESTLLGLGGVEWSNHLKGELQP